MNFKLLRTLKGIFLLSLLFCASSYAQIKKITGRVTDSSDGGPIPGANVSLKGKPSNVSTNANGEYTIQADPATDALVFSFIGFKRQSIALDGKSFLDVKLDPDNKALDEVVVIGYGTKKRSEVVGAISTIKGEDIEDIPAPNIAAALRNRIAGVSVSNQSGKPGSSITLNIRGSAASETAGLMGVTSEPLYVIDGITVPREDFDMLDPSMVDNISFLKDASAAIYGAAGAKGVVIVTTKTGKVGKPKLTYTGFYGITDATRTPDMLSAYDHAVLLNDGYRVGNAPSSSFFSAEDLAYLKGYDAGSWFEALWSPSVSTKHNLSVSGGSEAITFFVGGSYSNEGGNYGKLTYNKFSFRSGMNAKIAPGLTAGLNFSLGVNKKTSDAYKGGGEKDQVFFQQLITTPKWVPIQIDGKAVNFNDKTNPFGAVGSGNNSYQNSLSMQINATLNYAPAAIPGLGIGFQFAKSYGNGNDNTYVPPYIMYNFLRTGNNNLLFTNELDPKNPIREANTGDNAQLNPGLSRSSSYQTQLRVNYDKTINKHSFNVMVAGDQSESENESLSVYWRTQMLPDVMEYWAFDTKSLTLNGRSISESAKRSFIGRVSYDFDKKYFLEAIARYDASSKFAPEHRWGLFPSIGLGWNISEEKFFKDNIRAINFLKLRVNYGLVGEDRVNDRLWQDRLKIDVMGYAYNDNQVAGLNPEILANPGLTWEKARTFNAGMDMELLDSKFSLGFNFYTRFSYDMFDRGLNETFPMYAGFIAPVKNYQERTSWGTEFSVGYRANFTRDLKFSTDINFGLLGGSRIDRMYYNEFQLWDNAWPDLKYEFGTNPAYYNSSNFGLISKGIIKTQADLDAILNKYPTYTINKQIPQVGWLYYEDTNGDGVITEKDQVPMFSKTSAGFGFGMSFALAYKSFSLSTNLVARIGGKAFYDSKAKEDATATSNVPAFWKDHWSLDNPEGKFPRFDDPGIVANWNSTFWAVDATMLRINNMSLNYKVPASFTQKLGIGSARIGLTGNNLWTIINPLPYKDPNTSSVYDYPLLSNYSLNLGVSF